MTLITDRDIPDVRVITPQELLDKRLNLELSKEGDFITADLSTKLKVCEEPLIAIKQAGYLKFSTEYGIDEDNKNLLVKIFNNLDIYTMKEQELEEFIRSK